MFLIQKLLPFGDQLVAAWKVNFAQIEDWKVWRLCSVGSGLLSKTMGTGSSMSWRGCLSNPACKQISTCPTSSAGNYSSFVILPRKYKYKYKYMSNKGKRQSFLPRQLFCNNQSAPGSGHDLVSTNIQRGRLERNHLLLEVHGSRGIWLVGNLLVGIWLVGNLLVGIWLARNSLLKTFLPRHAQGPRDPRLWQSSGEMWPFANSEPSGEANRDKWGETWLCGLLFSAGELGQAEWSLSKSGGCWSLCGRPLRDSSWR